MTLALEFSMIHKPDFKNQVTIKNLIKMITKIIKTKYAICPLYSCQKSAAERKSPKK